MNMGCEIVNFNVGDFIGPEKSMFYIYKASKLTCPNPKNACPFCPYEDFCMMLKECTKYIIKNRWDLIEKFEEILKDNKEDNE